MKRLYAEDERYTEEGITFNKEVTDVLRPLLEKWHEAGYSNLDMLSIGTSALSVLLIMLRWKYVKEADGKVTTKC